MAAGEKAYNLNQRKEANADQADHGDGELQLLITNNARFGGGGGGKPPREVKLPNGDCDCCSCPKQEQYYHATAEWQDKLRLLNKAFSIISPI